MKTVIYYLSLLIYYTIGNKVPEKLFGKYIRYILVKNIFTECGKNVNIGEHVYFGKGKNIKIGDGSGLGKNSKIMGSAFVKIESDVIMGPEVMIITGNHNISLTIEKDEVKRVNKNTQSNVVIKSGCFIGARATILGGVIIDEYNVIGANALVNKDTEAYGLYVGVPSKRVKNLL